MNCEERINAGAGYFIKEEKKLREFLKDCPIVTDSRLHAKELNEGLKEIFSALSRNKYLLESLFSTFD